MSYKDIDENVKKYNNFNVKESKKKYGLKTYSKVRGCYIGDIMFEGDYAAFLILINVNTRYAYGYQIGDFQILQTKDKQQVQLYSTKNRKDYESMNRAFEKFITQLTLQYQNINILRFDGEKAINSKQFINYLKNYKIELVPAIPKQHTSLSIIDRLIRTLRDIAFNLGYDGIYDQNILDTILKYYNNSVHKTLSEVISKHYGKPTKVTPSMVQFDRNLEKIYVEECIKYNFGITSQPGFKLNVGDEVQISNVYNPLEKNRTILDKDKYKVKAIEGNLYKLSNTRTGKSIYRSRFQIKHI